MNTKQMVLSVVAVLFCAHSAFGAIERPKAHYQPPTLETLDVTKQQVKEPALKVAPICQGICKARRSS